jgi:hypothetical protein
VAITTLDHLSKTPARQCAKALQRVHGRPWKIVLLLDATRQPRASLHPDNPHTCNHGKGDVIGHQGTHVVLVVGALLMPLKPMPFSSQRSCQTHALASHSAQARVVASLGALALEDALGAYDRREVLVGAASGDDDQKIAQSMADKGGHCIIALSKSST